MTTDENITRNKCIFCQICDGKQDNEILYQDENFVAFVDRSPATTHHYLILPKTHYKNATVFSREETDIIRKLVEIGENLLRERKGNTDGIRMGFHWPPFNSVQHLHLHVIAPEGEMGFLSRLIFKKDSYWFVSPETTIDYLTKKST